MFEFAHHPKIQYFAIAGSVALLIFIIELVRRKKVKEEYSLLWFSFALAFLLFSLWLRGVERLAAFIGISYAPVAFLLILVMGIFLILIQFSVIISQLSEDRKNLAQEIALLKREIEKSQQRREEA
jgi:hypothetical protein